jgi:protein SCO1/2
MMDGGLVIGLRRVSKCLLLVLHIVLLATGCGGPSFQGKIQNPTEAAPDFTLTDQHGQPFHLSDQKGKVVLLYFGYTYCPDVCPTTMGDFKRIHQKLEEKADQVEFVFVTADPDRDKPERLKKYLEIFNPDFIGLVGTQEELDVVYEGFDVYVEKVEVEDSAAEYLVSHTATVFLIDPEGRWRLLYDYGTPPDDIVGDIEKLLEA